MINFGYNPTAECPITGDDRYKYKASDGLESVVHAYVIIAKRQLQWSASHLTPMAMYSFHKYG